MMGEINRFDWPDYVVFVAMFLVSIGIGLYLGFSGGGQKTTSEYLMGNRQLGLIPVTLSIAVSVVSANTLLGVPAEIYDFGINMALLPISLLISTFLVAIFFVPLLYPLMFTSVHEYLELRFKSKLVRILGTVLLFITQILYVGCVIFGPAIALETATGAPAWASIILVAVIATGYTALGGMKAVVWTDAFQSVVMLGGMLAVIILGTNSVGGFSRVWDINGEWDRLKVSFNPDPTERMSFWSFLLGYTVYWTGGYGVNQPCVQRYCAMKTEKAAKISMLLNGPAFMLLNTVSAVAGLVVFAYYTDKRCDPLESGLISNANQLLPYFVMEVLNYPCLPGLFIACLFSGSLSTVSSSINSMSAVVWEDIMKDHYEHLPESRKTLITKLLVVIFGFVCAAVAVLVWIIGGNLVQVASSFFGASIGPLLGLYLLGALFPWANWIGAFTGGTIAMLMNFWMLLGQTIYNTQGTKLPSPTDGCYGDNNNVTVSWTTPDITTEATGGSLDSGLEWLYSVSFTWYPVSAIVITMVVGIFVSLVTGTTDPSEVDRRLFFGCLREKYGWQDPQSYHLGKNGKDNASFTLKLADNDYSKDILGTHM